jgi:HSP20 family protein
MKAMQSGQIRVVRRGEPVVYIPRVDIVNDPESPRFLGIFELPGLKSADINISLKDGYIVVHGNRQSPYTKSGSCTEESCPDAMDIDLESFRRAQVNVRELRYGPFARRIKVPPGTEESDVNATLTEGMLRVTWPKCPQRDDSPSRVLKDEPSSPSLSPRSTNSSPATSPKNSASTLQ